MGRSRSRRTGGEELIDLISRLPPWMGLTIALVGYLVLHSFASRPLAAVANPSHASEIVHQGLLRGLATAGQYIVPIIGIAGAVASVVRRFQRRQLVANVAHSKSAGELNTMTWQQFEALVGQVFRQQGYAVQETGGGGADGGIDLVLKRGGEMHLVQCKQWRAYKVGVDVVRELYGVMAARGAAGGFVVTSGRFTNEAQAFAEGRNIRLLDGAALHRSVREAKAGDATASSTTPSPRSATSPAGAAAAACPLCGGPMTKRTARKGQRAGTQFWGCGRFPNCTGTRDIA